MGYLSHHSIYIYTQVDEDASLMAVDAETEDAIRRLIAEQSDDAWMALDGQECKWYEWQEELENVTLQFTDMPIIIFAEAVGEDGERSALWVADGQSFFATVTITYGYFDRSNLS